MVSERSELFAAHPDWAIGIPGRPRTEGRQQLVLDLGRPEVVDHLERVLTDVLAQRAGLLRQVGHEPLDDRAVEPVARGRPPGRVHPPLHPRRVRAVRPADRGGSPTSCSSRARAAAAGSTPGCWRTRRRPGRATTRTRSSGWRSSGASSLAYPLSSMGAHVSAVAEPPGRADHADRDAGGRRVLRGLRVRARHDGPDRGRAGGGPRPGRVLPRAPRRSSSGVASSGSAAPSRATATRRPGWSCRTTGARRSSASTGC